MDKDTKKAERHCQIKPFNFLVAQNHYEKWSVRIVFIDDEPWFVVLDLCSVLKMHQIHRPTERIPEAEKRLQDTPTARGWQKMFVVNEQGLCRFLYQSRKPEAKKFQNWVFDDLLPQIRKTYSMPYKIFSFISKLCRYMQLLCTMPRIFSLDRGGFPIYRPTKGGAR